MPLPPGTSKQPLVNSVGQSSIPSVSQVSEPLLKREVFCLASVQALPILAGKWIGNATFGITKALPTPKNTFGRFET